MKLIIAIVQDEDAQKLTTTLMNDGYSVPSWQLPVAF